MEEREEEGGRRWGEDLCREDQAERRRGSKDGRRRMSRLRSGDSLVDDEVLDGQSSNHSIFSNSFTILI